MERTSPGCPSDEEIARWLDGALVGDEARRIEGHAAACADCHALVAGAAPVHAAPRPSGSLVARYVIRRILGIGGMGIVYEAHDPELDRDVAIKLLRKLDAAGADALRVRLVREAQAMARLTHPNVVTVYDVGAVDGEVFIVMELVNGTTLTRWLTTNAPSVPEVLDVFGRVGEGLAAAHDVGLVHRDVKPDNVLMADDGRVLVTDFGLSREVALRLPVALASVERVGLTETGTLLGTPAYMSPEQLAGGEVSAQSDEFSFCVALYEALYQERPFAGDDVAALRDAVVRGEVRAAPKKSRVPAWLRAALLRGLSADPTARFAGMRALLDELGRDRAGERRRRRWVAAAALLAISAVAVPVARWVARVRLCQSGARRFDAVLNPTQIAALGQVPAGVPGGAESQGRRARAVQRLSTYRREWIALFQDACEAAILRSDEPRELYDLRASCLDEQLAATGRIATLLAHGDAQAEEQLLADAAPPALAWCSRAALLATTPLPRDPVAREHIWKLREWDARVEALTGNGDYPEAVKQGKELVDQARALGYPPTIADALYALGRAEALNNELPAGVRDCTAAIMEAEVAHDDLLVARARVYLASLAVYQQDRAATAGPLVAEARAALTRAGGDVDIESQLLDIEATVAEAQASYPRAISLYEQSLQLLTRNGRGDSLAMGYLENDLGEVLFDHDLGDAIPHFDRAVAIETAVLGAHHPIVLIARANRVRAMDPGAAQIAAAQALVADWQAVETSPNRVDMAQALVLYGHTLSTSPWRRGEAITPIMQGLALLRARLPADHSDVADAEAELAAALNANQRFSESQSHARSYLEFAEHREPPNHELLRAALRLYAETMRGAGKRSEARAAIQRAMALNDVQPAVRDGAQEHFILAQLLDAAGAERGALTEARAAEAGWAKKPIKDDERLAQVRAWLAAHAR